MTYDEHRLRANALVKGWETRPVTQQAWEEAEEHIANMFAKAATPEEEEKAIAAMDKLGRMHTLWRESLPAQQLEIGV